MSALRPAERVAKTFKQSQTSRRDHEPSGGAKIHFTRLTTEWLREGAKFWMGRQLERKQCAWGTMRARQHSLLYLQRYLDIVGSERPRLAGPDELGFWAQDFRTWLRHQKVVAGAYKGQPLGAAPRRSAMTAVKQPYRFMFQERAAAPRARKQRLDRAHSPAHGAVQLRGQADRPKGTQTGDGPFRCAVEQDCRRLPDPRTPGLSRRLRRSSPAFGSGHTIDCSKLNHQRLKAYRSSLASGTSERETLTRLQTCIATTSAGSNWAKRLENLPDEFDSVSSNPVGFPREQDTDEFWQRYLQQTASSPHAHLCCYTRSSQGPWLPMRLAFAHEHERGPDSGIIGKIYSVNGITLTGHSATESHETGIREGQSCGHGPAESACREGFFGGRGPDPNRFACPSRYP